MSSPQRCPCGSGEVYPDCCGRFHRGEASPPTARALMASRFSAFAVGDARYLAVTWHPSTRPAAVTADPDVRWLRLEIVDVVAGGPFDADGIVEFRAYYRSAAGRAVLHERSSFVREDGEWRYLTGDVVPHRPRSAGGPAPRGRPRPR